MYDAARFESLVGRDWRLTLPEETAGVSLGRDWRRTFSVRTEGGGDNDDDLLVDVSGTIVVLARRGVSFIFISFLSAFPHPLLSTKARLPAPLSLPPDCVNVSFSRYTLLRAFDNCLVLSWNILLLVGIV